MGVCADDAVACYGESLFRTDLDLVLGNDITTPVAIREMEKMNSKEVFHKDKIALVMDHFIPGKMPFFPPASIAIFAMVKRSSIDRFLMPSPVNSIDL